MGIVMVGETVTHPAANLEPDMIVSGQSPTSHHSLLMLDDKTPSVACVVQVVKPTADGDEPTVIGTMLSDENGKYQFTHFQSKA